MTLYVPLKRERSYERERTNYPDTVRRGFDEIVLIPMQSDGEFWLSYIDHFDLWFEWDFDHLPINYVKDFLPSIEENLNAFRHVLTNLIQNFSEY